MMVAQPTDGCAFVVQTKDRQRVARFDYFTTVLYRPCLRAFIHEVLFVIKVA